MATIPQPRRPRFRPTGTTCPSSLARLRPAPTLAGLGLLSGLATYDPEPGNDGMRYARVAPDRIAGTISVTCTRSASPDETQVTVTHDVTSLGPDGAAFVEEFSAGYDAF